MLDVLHVVEKKLNLPKNTNLVGMIVHLNPHTARFIWIIVVKTDWC